MRASRSRTSKRVTLSSYLDALARIESADGAAKSAYTVRAELQEKAA